VRKEVKWDSLGDLVYNLKQSVDEIRGRTSRVAQLLQDLSTSPYQHEAFKDILSSIQLVVDDMCVLRLSNVDWWVSSIDMKIENVLSLRLQTSA
jgi:hypothetical protein